MGRQGCVFCYLNRGRPVRHRKAWAASGSPEVLKRCEVFGCAHQLLKQEEVPTLGWQPVAWVAQEIDLPTSIQKGVLPPRLLYLPGMQLEPQLLLDSVDLSKLPRSWPKSWEVLRDFSVSYLEMCLHFLNSGWLTHSPAVARTSLMH